MTRRTIALLATVLTLSITATGSALADVYYVTYTGTATGTDTNGLFGTAGATLNGIAFTSTYAYDPSQFGSAVQNSSGSPAYFDGGSRSGNTSPVLSASLAINGQTYFQGSSYYSENWIAGGYGGGIYTSAESSASNTLINQGHGSAVTVATSFTTSQAFSISSGLGGGYSWGTGSLLYNGETITLSDTYVSVTDGGPSIVPEPTSLALFVGGAAMFGLAISVRRTMSSNQRCH